MIYTVTHAKMREMASHWISKNEDLVIELGCNAGNFATLMHKKGVKYIGVDIQKDKIDQARKVLPKMKFKVCDITKDVNLLKKASSFVSFQCLEHIKEDKKVLNAITQGTKVIISVPNSKFKGHVRWYEVDGWKERFSTYIDLDKVITIQNPKKANKRAFLFRGNRNGYKD